MKPGDLVRRKDRPATYPTFRILRAVPAVTGSTWVVDFSSQPFDPKARGFIMWEADLVIASEEVS